MTREQRQTRAAELNAQADVNDAYRAAMELTTQRTGGMLGHLNNPSAYAAHGFAAANKRRMAADLIA